MRSIDQFKMKEKVYDIEKDFVKLFWFKMEKKSIILNNILLQKI